MIKFVSGWVTFISLLLSSVIMLILGIDSYAEGITPLLVEDEILVFLSYSMALVGGFVYLLTSRFWELDNPRIKLLKDQLEEAKLREELEQLRARASK